MKIHKLSPAEGSTTKSKRLGRGTGSGLGKTSGKGHKGQNARSGGGVRPGFEGGQMPLIRQLPKIGFTNNFRKVYTTINVGELEVLEAGSTVTAELLKSMGLISKIEPYGLKVLGNGTLTKALNIQAAKFTDGAAKKITAVGGTIEVR
ncbi:MAG: 50S ribosomal protein L15 [Clostridia bacterium]|nr:50S ribosomal protein L15 [Clostridia bacterium]